MNYDQHAEIRKYKESLHRRQRTEHQKLIELKNAALLQKLTKIHDETNKNVFSINSSIKHLRTNNNFFQSRS